MNNNGVSEVVGALLTVAVIVTAAGIIYTISHPVIHNSIDNINYRNAAKDMSEIKEIVRRMKYGSEISTLKVIQLNGGSMHNSRSCKVTINSSSISSELYSYTNVNVTANRVEWEIHDLTIEISEKEIVFESGIFEENYGLINPIPISKPDVVATEDALYISFYDFYGIYSVVGYRTTLNLKYNSTAVFTNVSAVEIESEFCELWKKSFEEVLGQLNVKPVNVTDSDCSDKKIEIEQKNNGDIRIIITRIEVI